MSLATPERIRTLRRKLYRKAKAEPAFRFYLLYDKIHRDDILEQAYALARSNGGAPGVDGRSFAAIEAAGLTEWLAGIRKELVAKTYRPAPVRWAPEPRHHRLRPRQGVGRAALAQDREVVGVRGWTAYFGYGTRLPAYRAIDSHVYERVRRFLVRRHKVPSHGTNRFPREAVFGALGVLHLRRVHLGPLPCASR